VRIPRSVTRIGDKKLGVPYVICYTPYVASRALYPIYLGGPLSDLPDDCRQGAARGYIFAVEHGISEICQWRNGYMDYFLEERAIFVRDAKKVRYILLFLIREGLLDKEAIRQFLRQYEKTDDIEVKAALLQYWKEHFGDSGTDGFSL
jgi:hypothetical protein